MRVRNEQSFAPRNTDGQTLGQRRSWQYQQLQQSCPTFSTCSLYKHLLEEAHSKFLPERNSEQVLLVEILQLGLIFATRKAIPRSAEIAVLNICDWNGGELSFVRKNRKYLKNWIAFRKGERNRREHARKCDKSNEIIGFCAAPREICTYVGGALFWKAIPLQFVE